MSRIRTPPSLKWLINRRARLAGELEKLQKTPFDIDTAEKAYAKAKEHLEWARNQVTQQRLREKLLTDDLEAIDNTLRQHEIQISPELIPPIATQEVIKLLPHGGMTRAIFTCLKRAEGAPVSTTGLTAFVASQIDRTISDREFAVLRRSVVYRVKTLCYQGKIVKTNSSERSVEGRWRLPDESLSEPLWKRKTHSDS